MPRTRKERKRGGGRIIGGRRGVRMNVQEKREKTVPRKEEKGKGESEVGNQRESKSMMCECDVVVAVKVLAAAGPSLDISVRGPSAEDNQMRRCGELDRSGEISPGYEAGLQAWVTHGAWACIRHHAFPKD